MVWGWGPLEQDVWLDYATYPLEALFETFVEATGRVKKGTDKDDHRQHHYHHHYLSTCNCSHSGSSSFGEAAVIVLRSCLLYSNSRHVLAAAKKDTHRLDVRVMVGLPMCVGSFAMLVCIMAAGSSMKMMK